MTRLKREINGTFLVTQGCKQTICPVFKTILLLANSLITLSAINRPLIMQDLAVSSVLNRQGTQLPLKSSRGSGVAGTRHSWHGPPCAGEFTAGQRCSVQSCPCAHPTSFGPGLALHLPMRTYCRSADVPRQILSAQMMQTLSFHA